MNTLDSPRYYHIDRTTRKKTPSSENQPDSRLALRVAQQQERLRRSSYPGGVDASEYHGIVFPLAGEIYTIDSSEDDL